MPRWIHRSLWAAALGLALPAAAPAQLPMPTPPPPAVEPAPGVVVPAPGVVVPAPGVVVPAPAAPVLIDPYRAATPYNATVVGRPVPNPSYNRPIFTLPCDIPNQNLDPLVLTPPDFGAHFRHFSGGKGGCGDDCGKGGGCGGLGWLKGKFGKGACGDVGGACATCDNTGQFIFGSSRTYFGESSREFFERPPSVDGLAHPHRVEKRATPAGYSPY
jgi:hypothetical protein